MWSLVRKRKEEGLELLLKVDEDEEEEDVEGAKQSFDEQGIFTEKLQKNDGHVVYVVQKVLISAKDDMRVGVTWHSNPYVL